MFNKIFDAVALFTCVIFVGTAVATLGLVLVSAITGTSPIDFSGQH